MSYQWYETPKEEVMGVISTVSESPSKGAKYSREVAQLLPFLESKSFSRTSPSKEVRYSSKDVINLRNPESR